MNGSLSYGGSSHYQGEIGEHFHDVTRSSRGSAKGERRSQGACSAKLSRSSHRVMGQGSMRLNEVEFGLSMIETEDYTTVAVKGNKSPGLASEGLEDFRDCARDASNLLKALAHEPRLMLLCMLTKGEQSVTELETMLSMRQPAVSQQLARLRMDGIVAPRRQGKTIYYSLVNEDVRRIMTVLYDIFCGKK